MNIVLMLLNSQRIDNKLTYTYKQYTLLRLSEIKT